MKAFLSFLLAAFITTPLCAQLTIPDTIEAYKPIVAGCNCIVPEKGKAVFQWSVDPTSASIASDDNSKLYIWAAPGQHNVEVVVMIETFKDVQVIVVDPNDPNNKDKWTLKTVQMISDVSFNKYAKSYTVGNGPGPGPTPPPPGPGPGPGPVPTDDFAAKAQTWLKAIPAANYSKDKALAVADTYKSVAAKAVATSGWNLDAFVSQTKAANSTKLSPADTMAWHDPFFVPLAKYQSDLFDQRKLAETDVAGIAQLWRDTADAITKAAF
jgi:hypothetical protein